MPMMTSYPSFDAYLADQPAKNQVIIRALRRFVKSVAPRLRESVKWGNGSWVTDQEPVVYVYSDKASCSSTSSADPRSRIRITAGREGPVRAARQGPVTQRH